MLVTISWACVQNTAKCQSWRNGTRGIFDLFAKLQEAATYDRQLKTHDIQSR